MLEASRLPPLILEVDSCAVQGDKMQRHLLSLDIEPDIYNFIPFWLEDGLYYGALRKECSLAMSGMCKRATHLSGVWLLE
jgi:hypothetical protein